MKLPPSAIRLSLASIALAASAATADAQITIGDAIRAADRSAFPNRIAAGRTATAAAQPIAGLKGILPSVRVEAGYVRTSDPIGVFGSTIRQRSITQANFDPNRLNYPDPISNFQSAVVVEQPLFNADAWAGRHAAVDALSATSAAADWTRLTLHSEVISAYYGAILATERAATLGAAARAAHANLSQAQAMVREGLVTKSDALLASVRAGDIDTKLTEAEGAATTARRRLVLLLCGDPGVALPPPVPSALPSATRIRSIAAPDTAEIEPAPRGDVRAASRAVDAARDDGLRAGLTRLPRINGFARYDWNSSAHLYAGDRNWTVGVMASWSLFAGGGDIADVRAAAGRTVVAQAEAEGAAANARLESEQTRTALIVALTRLSIAEAGVSQSAEAHRIVARKYEGGLATVVELLDAQAAELQSALGLSEARWGTIVAAAERLLALGRDPATLSAIDSMPAVAASDDAGARAPSRP